MGIGDLGPLRRHRLGWLKPAKSWVAPAVSIVGALVSVFSGCDAHRQMQINTTPVLQLGCTQIIFKDATAFTYSLKKGGVRDSTIVGLPLPQDLDLFRKTFGPREWFGSITNDTLAWDCALSNFGGATAVDVQFSMQVHYFGGNHGGPSEPQVILPLPTSPVSIPPNGSEHYQFYNQTRLLVSIDPPASASVKLSADPKPTLVPVRLLPSAMYIVLIPASTSTPAPPLRHKR